MDASSIKSKTTTYSGQSIPTITDESLVDRRVGNYKTSSWDYDFLQSLGTGPSLVTEKHVRMAEKLKNEVKSMITASMAPLAKLELVDTVQRLGLKYQFEAEIKEEVLGLYQDRSDAWWVDNLHATALRFRLLRQSGLFILQDVFKRFLEEGGKFKESLCEDVKGLLSLYEASFLSWEGESILDEAMAFSTMQLENLKEQRTSKSLAIKVKHALDLPLNWRVPRFEARWFIDAYEQEEGMSPTLLKLAKLDFNILQSIHQSELGKLARWWVGTGFDKLSFTRNNLMPSYMWGCAIASEPQLEDAREVIVKIGSMITIVDDVYDLYGSMEELELFTDFVDRWNINGIDQLPNTIKMILETVFKSTNEIGSWIQYKKGLDGIHVVSKEWADLCKAYLKEAKWYHEAYKPTLQEYLENGMVSVGLHVALIAGYAMIANSKAAVDNILDSRPPLLRISSILNRLLNDLGTSADEMARGDNLKSIQCYMNENGASEDAAREYIKGLIRKTWKTFNQCSFDHSQFGEPFKNIIINSVRGSQFFYQFGDGYGITESLTKDQLASVLLQPISFPDLDMC